MFQPLAFGAALDLNPLVVLVVTVAAGCLFFQHHTGGSRVAPDYNVSFEHYVSIGVSSEAGSSASSGRGAGYASSTPPRNGVPNGVPDQANLV
jgi:hypothetical protein